MRKTITMLLLLLVTVLTTQAQENLELTFANAEITTVGMTDFYEVDVLATATAASPDFKLGDVLFYVDYNTAAFGNNIDDLTVDFDYPAGSILGEVNFFGIYTAAAIADNTDGTIAISAAQFLSAGSILLDNVTATPRVLGHLKIEMIDSNESPDICFNVSGTNFDDEFFTACGPFTAGAQPADCAGEPGTQILDYDGSDCSGSIIVVDPCVGGMSTWTAGGGWDNGIPDNTMTAIINGVFNTMVNGNLDVCSMTITSLGFLTVQGGTFASVQNDITNDGDLFVEHTGSVVQVLPDAVTINNNIIDVNVSTPALDARDFMLLGSPMSMETREELAGFRMLQHDTNEFEMFADILLDDATNFNDADVNDWTPKTGVLTAGEGFYYIPGPDLLTGGSYALNFNDGTLNSGSVTYPTIFGDDKNDSPNILSNPYPSAIDTDMLIANNAAINEVYFWDHNTVPSSTFPGALGDNYNMDDISIRNAGMGVKAGTGALGSEPGQFMATAQGFAIKAETADPVVFTNAMRVTGENTTLRTPMVAERLWLNVYNEQYALSSDVGIFFSELATEGFEAQYDSKRIGTNISLFSQIEGSDDGYTIQGRESFNTSIEIPMGFSSRVAQDNTAYTINMVKREGNALLAATVYLIDNELGSVTDLTEQSYTFNSLDGNFPNRFKVVFNDDEVLGLNSIALDNITIYPNPVKNKLNITSSAAFIDSVEVFDILNKRVISASLDSMNQGTIDVSKLENAVYFITIKTDRGTVTRKFIKNQ